MTVRNTTPFIKLISFLSIFLICVWIASGTAYAATGIDGIGPGAETMSTDKYYGTVYTNDETG